MSVLYPLIQALVLFAVAPLLSGITRVARARPVGPFLWSWPASLPKCGRSSWARSGRPGTSFTTKTCHGPDMAMIWRKNLMAAGKYPPAGHSPRIARFQRASSLARVA